MGYYNPTLGKQTIESFDHLAFTEDGVAPIRITVINDYLVEVNTNGLSIESFACLKEDVKDRLKNAGYNLKTLNINL